MIAATRDYIAEVWDSWTEFWFAPTSPTTLSAIRVLAGLMLFYTHLVWSKGLTEFFGENGWLPTDIDAAIPQFRSRWARPAAKQQFIYLVALRLHFVPQVNVDDSHCCARGFLSVDDRAV